MWFVDCLKSQFKNTVEPLLRGHLWDNEQCPLNMCVPLKEEADSKTYMGMHFAGTKVCSV